MKDLDGSNQIRRLGVVRRLKRRTTGSKVEWKARHQREKAGNAPATQYRGSHSRRNEALAFSERQIVHNTLHKGMCAIEVVPCVIAALVDIEREATIVPGLKAHAFAESVGRSGRKTSRKPPVEFHLQGVVAGGESRKEEIRARISPEGTGLGTPAVAGPQHGSGIEVVVDDGVDAMITDIR